MRIPPGLLAMADILSGLLEGAAEVLRREMMKELTELDRQCVKCFAQSNMNGNEAARRMFVGRSTLSYHLEQGEIKTDCSVYVNEYFVPTVTLKICTIFLLFFAAYPGYTIQTILPH